MSSDKQLHKDKDFSFEPVPLYARKSFWSMFFIMLGFTFFSASMSVGAIIIFDYFGHPQHYKEGAEATPGVHWGAVAGVIAGALTGNFFHAGIASINAMIVGCFCYLVYDKAAGR